MDNPSNFYQKLGIMEADIAHIKESINDINSKIDKTNSLVSNSLQDAIGLKSLAINNDRRIRNLENNQSKIVWVLIVAVIGAVLKLVIIDNNFKR